VKCEWTITDDEKTPAKGETWHEADSSGQAAFEALVHVGCWRRGLDNRIKPMGGYWLLDYGHMPRLILVREKGVVIP